MYGHLAILKAESWMWMGKVFVFCSGQEWDQRSIPGTKGSPSVLFVASGKAAHSLTSGWDKLLSLDPCTKGRARIKPALAVGNIPNLAG